MAVKEYETSRNLLALIKIKTERGFFYSIRLFQKADKQLHSLVQTDSFEEANINFNLFLHKID